MFVINNIIIEFFAVGMAGIFLITFIMARQSNKVSAIMKHNRDVTPLLLHKSTQYKFNAIRTKLPNVPNEHHEHLRTELDQLVYQFKAQAICIKTYNNGLDNLMKQLHQNL